MDGQTLMHNEIDVVALSNYIDCHVKLFNL